MLFPAFVTPPMRARFWAAAPFGALLGAFLGGLLVRQGWISVPAIPLVAATVPLLTYISLLLQGAVMNALQVSAEGGISDVIGLAFDMALGAIIGHLTAPLLGVSALQSAGLASGILCFQTVVVEKVLIGNVFGEALNSLLFPTGARERPVYSRAEALASLGNYDAAQKEFERQIARFPTEPMPRIRFARMLRLEAGRHELAALILQQVLEMKKLDFESETAAVRDLTDLLAHRLNQPKRAALVLLRYLERHPKDSSAQWARRRLDGLAQALHKSGPVPP